MIQSNVIVISKEDRFLARINALAASANCKVDSFESTDSIVSDNKSDFSKIDFVVLDATTFKKDSDIVGLVQVVKQFCPHSYIVVIAEGKTRPEVAVFIKKSGANVVLLDHEYDLTSKPEYIWSQVIGSPNFAVKALEFRVGTKLDHDVLHFMPLNCKFIKVIPKGEVISQSKWEKMKDIQEFYIAKKDFQSFLNYSKQNTDSSPDILTQRCRLHFHQLTFTFSKLVLLLSDQSEHSSFAEGKNLFEQCLKCTDDLLTALIAVEDPWEVIDKASFGGYGSLDRGASIAAYAGIFSTKSNQGSPSDAMIGALMADIGLLDLSPQATAKLRRGDIRGFHAEERETYERHMVSSLNHCLSRRVPLSDNLKNIILCTHERFDGLGFPNKPSSEKIPSEAFLIQLSEKLDQQTVVMEDKARPDLKAIRESLFQQNFDKAGAYPITFLMKMKPLLIEKT